MSDQSDVYPGKDLGSYKLKIDRETIEKYVGGVGKRNPWYEENSPYGKPVAPAAILYYKPWHFPGWRPEGVRGVLNNAAEWEFYRPVYVDETLTLKAQITDRYVRRNRDHVVIEMTATNEAGETVCRGVSVGSWQAEDGITPPDLPRRD